MARLSRRDFLLLGSALGAAAFLPGHALAQAARKDRTNVILVMSDDQGWGDVGYFGEGKVKTPVLDEMAATGLRFDRFYAAAPVCSPTRGSCLTGRHPDRYGLFSWGYDLRLDELTIPEVLAANGYATGHFGKWHMGGVATDKEEKSNRGKLESPLPTSPENHGYEESFAAPNFYDLNPDVFQENGVPVGKIEGEGSAITVKAALDWLRTTVTAERPFFATVWFGNPHSPHKALEQDLELYAGAKAKKQRYMAEITAMDRAIGTLRAGLRELGVAENTLVWFCSDNGATEIGNNGGLRGFKGGLWEGGVRVPGLIEWPARIAAPMRTAVPASTLDMFPTIMEILGAEIAHPVKPIDGISLVPLIDGRMSERPAPIPFEIRANAKKIEWAALTGDRFKLHVSAFPGTMKGAGGTPPSSPELYDLIADPAESANVADAHPEVVARMSAELEAWQASVERSLAGADYANG